MTLASLTLAYVAIGVALALAALRRGRSALDAFLVVLSWPLYAPALRGAATEPPATDGPARAALAVRSALRSVRDAAAGSPFSTLLGEPAEARISLEIERAAARMRAVDHELETLEAARAEAQASSSGELRAEATASLRALRAADAAAMAELVDLLGALRSRIVLARHAGSSAEGPSAIVAEVWARIEGLGEAVACTQPRASAVAATPPLPGPAE